MKEIQMGGGSSRRGRRGGTCQDFTGVGFCPAPTTTLFLVNIIIINGINIIETIIFNINNNKTIGRTSPSSI